MDNAIYATLTRQSGLMREMRSVANNIANANTTGFRREGVVFSEHMVALDRRGETLAMANGRGRMVDLRPGGMTMTKGQYDLALEGDGFLMVQTPQGNRLTRAGAFMTNAEGELVNGDGHQLLDDGQAPIVIPVGVRSVGIGIDGTIPADGNPVGR
ncbi:MAG: flagellar hook-basal body complex protein, partial [Paracoccus sp.]|nr:flagellar hook-basal body complex protein [Paracoccus sp. (in: a-proteobacteria)]